MKGSQILQRLEQIERKIDALIEREIRQDWYSTAELAKRIHRSEFTTREYCRLGRLNAQKKRSGRGSSEDWAISHEELERYQRDGLLPNPSAVRRERRWADVRA